MLDEFRSLFSPTGASDPADLEDICEVSSKLNPDRQTNWHEPVIREAQLLIANALPQQS
jgi:hypothetical protein